MTVKINISPLLIIISSGIKITANKLVNESSLNRKIKTLWTKEETKKLARKAELKAEQGEIVKLQALDLSLSIGQSYFNNDEAQRCVIPPAVYHSLKGLGDTEKCSKQKRKFKSNHV